MQPSADIPSLRRNAAADADLMRTVFGPHQDVPLNYLTWRSKVRLEADIEESTYELLPLLRLRLRSAGIEDDFSGRLRGICRKVWVESQLSLASVSDLVGRIADKGPNVTLAGRTALAALYPDQIKFARHDPIELIVQPDHVETVLRVLVEAGWTRHAWAHQQNLFETDYVTLLDTNWRCLHLSWRALSGIAATALEESMLSRVNQVPAPDRSLSILTPLEGLLRDLTKEGSEDVFVRGVLLREFFAEEGDWDALQNHILDLGLTNLAAGRLRQLEAVADSTMLSRTIRELEGANLSLVESINLWADRLGDRPTERRLHRAANYISRQLRRSKRRHVGHLIWATIRYGFFRLTPARWRSGTVDIGFAAPAASSSALQAGSLDLRSGEV